MTPSRASPLPQWTAFFLKKPG